MLLCYAIAGLGLNKSGLGGVEIPTGDGSLREELSAGVYDALVEVEIRLGLSEIVLSFREVFRNLCLSGGFEDGLSGGIGALVVQGCGGKIAIFEGHEEFAGFHSRAAL